MWLAEDAARELPNLPLEDALQLVHLYAERGSPKYEAAAMRWLERYLTEASPGGSSTSRRSRRVSRSLRTRPGPTLAHVPRGKSGREDP
jgi:hypothetical protein